MTVRQNFRRNDLDVYVSPSERSSSTDFDRISVC